MRREPDPAEDLRAALRGIAEVSGDGSDCPSGDRLVSSARRELPRDADREVNLHLARCTACGAAWRVAREIAGEGVATARPASAET